MPHLQEHHTQQDNTKAADSVYRSLLTWLVLVDLLQQRLGVVGRVELHHLRGVAVVDLRDELRQLAAHRLVELLEELQTSALCVTGQQLE